MANVKFRERFAPAEATRGQYVPIDTSTLSDYPVSGSRGRYAVLNYIIGSEPGALNVALSGGNVILPVSSVTIDEPVRVENDPGQDFVVTTNLPDTTYIESLTVGANTSAVITFGSAISLLEVYNNDTSNKVYLNFGGTTFADLTGKGLPIEEESFYSVDLKVTTVTIGNPNGTPTDVRVFGHYIS